MKFIPFKDKIVIEPIEKKGIIETGEKMFLESGKVIDFGTEVDFVKKGDIVHFQAYGCTEIKHENKSYWVVSTANGIILGKHGKE